MIDEMPKGYNIGWNVVGNRCVTTGAIPASNPYEGYYLMFETIIWFWDGKERKHIIHQIPHRSENEAKKVHAYITNNLTI